MEFDALDWKEVLSKLASFATSEVARAKLAKTLPLKSPDEAKQSFREISEALAVLSHGERPFMESLDLYPTWSVPLKRHAVSSLPVRNLHFRSRCLAGPLAAKRLRGNALNVRGGRYRIGHSDHCPAGRGRGAQ